MAQPCPSKLGILPILKLSATLLIPAALHHPFAYNVAGCKGYKCSKFKWYSWHLMVFDRTMVCEYILTFNSGIVVYISFESCSFTDFICIDVDRNQSWNLTYLILIFCEIVGFLKSHELMHIFINHILIFFS